MPALSAGEPDLTEETQIPDRLPSELRTASPLMPIEVTSLPARNWLMIPWASWGEMA
jgi:hypothetical protein